MKLEGPLIALALDFLLGGAMGYFLFKHTHTTELFKWGNFVRLRMKKNSREKSLIWGDCDTHEVNALKCEFHQNHGKLVCTHNFSFFPSFLKKKKKD